MEDQKINLNARGRVGRVHVAVILRAGPPSQGSLRIADGQTDISHEATPLVLGESDDYALEEATVLKEAHNATVTAVVVGAAPQQLPAIATARGADRVVELPAHSVGASYDSRRTFDAIARTVEHIAADLVLVGMQSHMDVFGEVGASVAGLLSWPHVSSVHGIALGESSAVVRQERAAGRVSAFEIALPAVIGISNASRPPRQPPMARLLKATRALQRETYAPETRDLPIRSIVIALARPPVRREPTMLGADVDSVARAILAIFERQ